MFAGSPEIVPVGTTLDEVLETVPTGAGVFAIWLHEGEPYLGKTGVLRKRLKRLLHEREQPSRLLHLRALAKRVEYWPVGAKLQSDLVFYDLACRYFPDRYLDLLKLRMPTYVKLLLSNRFPRIQVTSHLFSGPAKYYGPFRSRAAADAFEHEFLDLFQIRRCSEDLQPFAEHPGCMYGEMGMCLRPCQTVVSHSEYASEVSRVANFLTTGGKTLLRQATAARDRLSDDMQFEEAARLHKRVDRIERVLKLQDELVCDIDELHGVALTPSPKADSVLLWLMARGIWQHPRELVVGAGSPSESLDRRLRDILATANSNSSGEDKQNEHLAILARWFYSTYRDGEWIPFPSLQSIPYRRLVNAISRTMRARV